MRDGAWLPADDPSLPESLRHVTAPCAGLWLAGDAALLDRRPRIGVIGSRRPRDDAAVVARRIARETARAGFTIVSGLAIGIDGMAHEAALDAGGATIAVLPSGLGSVYPASNRSLARRIVQLGTRTGVTPGIHPDSPGLVLSEYGRANEPAHRHRFRERNRIIAALCDYLVVVQANIQSGSMITAQVALELGIPIGIVPSSPDDPCYAGSTALIHDGADAVVDGHSLFRRLELHGIMHAGFAEAARYGARIDPDRPGAWLGGNDEDGVQLALDDHPLASLLQLPRSLDELAELAGMSIRDARMMVMELEEEGRAVHTDEGAWLAVDALR